MIPFIEPQTKEIIVFGGSHLSKRINNTHKSMHTGATLFII